MTVIYSADAVFERIGAFLGVPFHRRSHDGIVVNSATNMRGETVTLTLGDLRFALQCVEERAQADRAEDANGK